MIIKVKRAKAHGWTNLKSYAGAKTRIGCPLDSFGKNVTGLTKDDEERLERELSLDTGTLSRNSPFWDTFFVDIDGVSLTLDTESPEHELWYKFLCAQKKVAKSMGELKTNARAIFVMYNEDDEAAKENKRGKNKRLAYKLFDELSTNDMKNVLLLFGDIADSTSPDMIEKKLSDILEDDPALFLATASDKNLKSKVFILELVKSGLLTKKGSAFIDPISEDILAFDMENMVSFIEDKRNNGKVIQLKTELKNRS